MTSEADFCILENLLESLLQIKESGQISSTTCKSQSTDILAAAISEFHFDPENNVTFDTWFRRYEDIFGVDLSGQDDDVEVRLLLRKLGAADLGKILQSHPSREST